MAAHCRDRNECCSGRAVNIYSVRAHPGVAASAAPWRGGGDHPLQQPQHGPGCVTLPAGPLVVELLGRHRLLQLQGGFAFRRPRQGQPPQEKIPTSCVERGGEVMAMQDSPRQPIPIRQRRLDLLFVAFFLMNFGFITYVVDLEQVVIAGPAGSATHCGRRHRCRSGPLVRGVP